MADARVGEKLLTVDDFGAKGDGKADDTQAFRDYTAYLRKREKENLPQRAEADLSTLLDSGRLEVDHFSPPQQVDSQASMLQKGSNWIISASGGVKISPWAAAEKTEESEALATPHVKAAPAPAGNWWWN